MFGERVEGYSVPVLNEREVRAGAGILFFITTVVFLGAWHADLMLPAQLMIVGFFIDFVIRVINPRYSPSLILGRIAVNNQTPEYTAAAPKRFAWWLGLTLASIMIVTLVFMRQMSFMNFSICALCIVLLFMESSFGICLGCLVYNKVLKKEVQLCPGDICAVKTKAPIQEVHGSHIALLIGFAGVLYLSMHLISDQNSAIVHHGPNHQIMQDLKGAAKATEAPKTPPAASTDDAHAQHKH
jgi:hypothetical protein